MVKLKKERYYGLYFNLYIFLKIFEIGYNEIYRCVQYYIKGKECGLSIEGRGLDGLYRVIQVKDIQGIDDKIWF